METPDHTPLSQDAALVLALAGTAVTFASSEQDEAERWLRVLRMHGQVGCTLQALGVGEAPLENGSEPKVERVRGARPLSENIVDVVAGRASAYAKERNSEAIGTVHVLFAVLEVYDRLFDRALYRRGTTRAELLERLAECSPVASDRT